MRKIESPPSIEKYQAQALRLWWQDSLRTLINRINEDYLYWDKVKYQKVPDSASPELLWTMVKLSRHFREKWVMFGKYRFKFNLTNTIQKALHEFDLHIGGHLGSDNLIPPGEKDRYLISSIMEEAIASSQIEGAVTTRRKAKEMLRKNAKPRNKSEQMIMNNYMTIKHIVEIKDQPLTVDRLLEVHRLITHLTLDNERDEGRFRTDNEINVVDAIDGEIVHMPPDHSEVSGLMNELMDFFNDKDQEEFMHPIVKGCIIHFMMGFIHPFVDGNGRCARALFYWYMLRRGYWLTEYLSISRLIVKSKTQYAMAFIYSEVDGNDLTYFIHYKLKTMTLAYQSLREYIQRKINEKKSFIHFQKIKGINERQATIIKWIFDDPDILLTVKEVETRLGVSNQTSRNDLLELVDRGFLQILEVNKKTRAFCKGSSFDAIVKKELGRNA